MRLLTSFVLLLVAFNCFSASLSNEKVLVIGNSLARHDVKSKIGWTNCWGMAASAEENDYAHLIERGIAVRTGRTTDLRVRNLAGYERSLAAHDLSKMLAEELVWGPDWVVIQLGENAPTPTNLAEEAKLREGLTAIYRLMGGAAKRVLACTVYTPNLTKVRLQREAARDAGVGLVRLYDIGAHDEYLAKGLFWHEGVAGHPGDRGMALIAERVLDAFFPPTLPKWTGEALVAWRSNDQVKNLRVEGGVLKGRAIGRDAQLCTNLKVPFAPRGNQTFGVRMKLVGPGKCQLFWCRRGDEGFSELRQNKFAFEGGGTWQSAVFFPHWCGPEKVKSLRFDLPPGAADSDFEIAEIVVGVDETVPEFEVDARRSGGVAFSLQVPSGLHYGQLHWVGEKIGLGEFDFTTATDGRRHAYWFDLRTSKDLKRGPHRGQPNWTGVVSQFWGELPFAKTPLKLEDLHFCTRKPETPPDPVVMSAYPDEAIVRAGRPFVVEVIVRNFGTRPAENLCFSFDGLPSGVKPLDPLEIAPVEPLPGTDGRETLNNFGGPQLAGERVYRIRLSDLGVGRHSFGLTLAADGVVPRRVEIVADVKPSLGLKREDYPPEPKPISTGKYEIGALLFPGWTIQKWHAVWSHDPIRKPLLGWYDETQPVTVDWQIKHLVENGISFVSVDWYWRDGKRYLTHWQETFAKARYRKYLKWHLMWDNGFNSAEDQDKLARHWCETCFNDPQYQKVDGKPIVAICNPQGMENHMIGKGGAKRLVDITQRIAREHGFPGVYFVAMRGMGQDSEDPTFLRRFADWGFDLTTVYGFRGGIPGTIEGSKSRRSYVWLADVSPAHWRALCKNGTLPFWPSLSTGYDDRPWRGERVLEIYGYNAKDFRRICEEGRKLADETGVKTFLVGPLDEWGEGSIGYPNREHGFGILEAVRDTFGVKPAEGWPINYAPEDIGLQCPQGNGRD